MTLPVQFVFDTNILVDMVLARGNYYQYAVQLLDEVADNKIEGWYAPHTITTVYYLVERTLAAEADSRAEAEQKARKLVQALVTVLKPLPQVGNEINEIESVPGNDYEDEAIIHLAKNYLPNPLIVTRDKAFLKVAEINAAHPKEIVEDGLDRWLPEDSKINFIDLAVQQRQLRPRIEQKIHRVLAHGQYIMGPEVKQLEQKLADFVGVKHCISASSGTDTLLIAMMALGIGAGDEVITTPFTFIATGEMIALLGAIPVFVDIEPQTYNIDPTKIEAAITAKTKAIMPVSLYGQCADIDAINAIANKHQLPVIEDAAQSFGATYKGKRSCGLSTIGSTSFFPSKPLGGYGDGGALFTDDDELAKLMREIRLHGQDRRYHHPRIGINGRLDTLQAAVVLAKMERFDWEIEQRQQLGQRYSQLINQYCPPVITPYIAVENSSVYAQYTIQVESREQVIEKLKQSSIPTAVHYPVPLNQQPAFSQLTLPQHGLTNSEKIALRVMSLPMSPDLTENEQDRIVEALERAIEVSI